ncbi:MAG: hypothetical protein V1815_01050 [Candidatus Woesearchaeota archaeon]
MVKLKTVTGVLGIIVGTFWLVWGVFLPLEEFAYVIINILPGLLVLLTVGLALKFEDVGGLLLIMESFLPIFRLLFSSSISIKEVLFLSLPVMLVGFLFLWDYSLFRKRYAVKKKKRR